MSEITPNTWLAVCGVIVSVVACIWNIRRDRKNRSDLRVECSPGEPGPAGPAGTEGRVRLVFRITNAGKRPAVVTRLEGCGIKGKEPFPLACGELPATLAPGERVTVSAAGPGIPGGGLRSLFAVDAAGQRHYVKSSAVKDLVNEHARANP